MKVKGNTVLASARKRLKDIANITLKAEIHGMLKQGLHGTCPDSEVKQLRLWCGMPAASTAEPPSAMKVPTSLQIQIASERVQSKALDKINSFLSSSGVKTITMERKKRVFKVKPKKAAPKKKPIDNNQSRARPKNGGARKGSGRKKGAATKKTREIADKLVADGDLTPLEYTLSVMRETPEKLKAQHDKGDIDVVEYTIKMQELIRRKDKAAETAMSFIHPRLSSIDASIGLRGHDLFVALMAEEAK